MTKYLALPTDTTGIQTLLGGHLSGESLPTQQSNYLPPGDQWEMKT